MKSNKFFQLSLGALFTLTLSLFGSELLAKYFSEDYQNAIKDFDLVIKLNPKHDDFRKTREI